MNFIYLGCSGFPYGKAAIERQRLLAKSLVKKGNKVIIINRKGTHEPGKTNFNVRDIYEGIHYIYTSGNIYRHANFIIRNIYKVIGVIGELFFILKLSYKSRIDAVIVSSMVLNQVKYYYFLSKLLRVKLILDYVEMSSALEYSSLKDRRNNILFDKLAPKNSDGVICISNYLLNHVQDCYPKLPVMKIPAVCDFEQINNIKVPPPKENYFLFCGTIAYIEIVEFILDAYRLCTNSNYLLYLVVSGSAPGTTKFKKMIESHPRKSQIRAFANLEYEDLIKLYKQARSLLIPLRPTIQDEARFPHKIGEYTASGRPIITTHYGEIPNYFTDMENALIADEYEPKAFAAKMDFASQFPDITDAIGKNGQDLCLRNFDFQLFGEKITTMVSSSNHPEELMNIKVEVPPKVKSQ